MSPFSLSCFLILVMVLPLSFLHHFRPSFTSVYFIPLLNFTIRPFFLSYLKPFLPSSYSRPLWFLINLSFSSSVCTCSLTFLLLTHKSIVLLHSLKFNLGSVPSSCASRPLPSPFDFRHLSSYMPGPFPPALNEKQGHFLPLSPPLTPPSPPACGVLKPCLRTLADPRNKLRLFDLRRAGGRAALVFTEQEGGCSVPQPAPLFLFDLLPPAR